MCNSSPADPVSTSNTAFVLPMFYYPGVSRSSSGRTPVRPSLCANKYPLQKRYIRAAAANVNPREIRLIFAILESISFVENVCSCAISVESRKIVFSGETITKTAPLPTSVDILNVGCARRMSNSVCSYSGLWKW